ncbi:ATP-dependent zinc metalloprotease FtsH [Limnochorda pilosa]|uniref:ATP-dependent zinc metalloprotease FtsH n=1 Tax=Limnochorda pilosa TaxID=1555112 RepID=A0A0K2SQD8_LIMPI|nr:ATP-dependent zinc metalloprotease FtsH [Limnochorda pilosa]BAS29343.1 cell division protein FtsH [Limnochorda pilosa]
MNRFLRGLSLYLLIAVLAVMIVSTFYTPSESARNLDYTEFVQSLNAGRIASVKMVGEQEIHGRMKDGTEFKTFAPPNLTNLADQLLAKGVQVSAAPTPPPAWWVSILPNVLMLVVFVGLWLFILNQMQGGNNRAMSFGKSRAKLHTEEKSKVRFDDVAGLDEAKMELQEIVEFLKHPKKFVELGAKIPKGVLLVGPPGTGKTLLGRAVAGEAGVPFFSISGSDFVEMFVGVGASRVRDLFDTAKKNSPCIVFIDELDAVGRHRGAGLGGGHDEREQTLNQLLVEMDGFEPNTGIIIMAATNRPDVLDPALLRPGRFDRKVIVDRADLQGRIEILKIHSRNKPLAEDVSLETLARRTPGFSGADLENLMNEAAILAARRGVKRITMADCEEAIDRVLLGPEKKKRVLTERDKEVFAYHEAGHAVVAHFLPHGDPVHKVTIIGRGMAGGYTMTLPAEERYVATRAELTDRLAHMLGGRTAEEVAFDEISTGAQDDLEKTTSLSRRMVMEWGMSDELGPLTFGNRQGEIFLGRDIARERNYSEEVAAAIDKEVRRLVDEAHRRARQILTEHWDRVVKLVEVLKDRETVDEATFRHLMEEGTLPEAKPAPEPQPKVPESVAAATTEAPERPEGRTPKEGLGKQRPKPAVGLE